jgi:hypothetical protein
MTTKDMNGPRAITVDAQIAELKARLAIAESGRDTWRAARNQENYLAAYSMVEALAMQLEALERTRRFPAAAEAGSVYIASPAASPDASAGQAAPGITFNGRRYSYRGFRYDHLADAVNYAELDRSRAFADPGADDAAPLERVPRPSAVEREHMRTLGITYADGVFSWGEYRYDRLADAIAYARRGETS